MNNDGKTMDSSHMAFRLKSPPKETQRNDAADPFMNLANLSPTTQENLNLIIKSLSTGEAHVEDRHGKPHIEYKGVSKLHWDGSNANILAVPKSDPQLKTQVEACLELLDFHKNYKKPSGVVVDMSHISVSPGKLYRELKEFEKLKQTLGKGNSGVGDIVVLKDLKTGQKHAQKTIMISTFRGDEVRCWMDLNATGHVPHMYMFRIIDNRVEIHMEILQSAKTFSSIIDEHMARLQEPQFRHLVKPFSLYVLDGAIEAISCMHNEGWTHNDMHSGNAMLDSKLKVKIIDFGLARSIKDTDGILQVRNFQQDIGNVLRIFSGLYTTEEYTSVWDMQKRYEEIGNTEGYMGLSRADRIELFNLIDAALKITNPKDVKEYRKMVKESLENGQLNFILPSQTKFERLGLIITYPFLDFRKYLGVCWSLHIFMFNMLLISFIYYS
ncbi:serine/threonine-protein kinase 38-like [Dreissena polymorpha]|uniref:serine/threonine-protein kinase 38-like n=1 Tax=Dreissena polymorpha TaxID=45954 RepID=UPI0022650114|nr:serine/threonine-protein kinase 38-like [Dreissena polymorpha]